MSPDTIVRQSIEQGTQQHLVEKYLFPASLDTIRCVDERQAIDASNGVEFPGGIYGIIDEIKRLSGCSEDEAWEKARQANIPLDDHIDEHHGAKGCGYARLVEEQHETVLAPESVPAQKRLEKIQQLGGKIQTLLGEHHPTHAVINHRIHTSIDPDQATENGLGIFNFDKWAAKVFGERLGFDPQKFADDLEKVYRRTVTALTGIQDFVILE